MKLKPQHADFAAFPEIDFRGKLDNPVSYQNSYAELVSGMKNPVFRRNMGDAAVQEIFTRAYNYTALMFAGYNRLSYICMMYAEEVKKQFMADTKADGWFHHYLIGLMTCDMAGLTHPNIKEPFLIIGGEDRGKAIDRYNELVPLTAYYPAHVIAYKNGDGAWTLDSRIVTEQRMIQIVEQLNG